MAARGHFVFPIDDTNHRVLVIWDLNGYGEYLIGVFVTKLWPVQALACGGGGDGGGDGGGGATKTIISPTFSNFGDIIRNNMLSYVKQRNSRLSNYCIRPKFRV